MMKQIEEKERLRKLKEEEEKSREGKTQIKVFYFLLSSFRKKKLNGFESLKK